MKNEKLNSILILLSIMSSAEVCFSKKDNQFFYLLQDAGKYTLSPLLSEDKAERKFIDSPTELTRVQMNDSFNFLNSTSFAPHSQVVSGADARRLDAISMLLARCTDVAGIKTNMLNMVSTSGDTIYFRPKTHHAKASFLLKSNFKLKELAEEIESLFVLKQILSTNSRTHKKNEDNYLSYFVVIDKNKERTYAQELPHTYSQLSTIKSELIVDINSIIDKQTDSNLEQKKNVWITKIKSRVVAFAIIVLIFVFAWLFTSESGNNIIQSFRSEIPVIVLDLKGKDKDKATTLPINNIPKKIYSKQDITELINNYCTNNNTKIWKQRRAKIITSFNDLKLSEWEAKQLIKKGAKQ